MLQQFLRAASWELLFLEHSYIQRHLQTTNAFYKEGLLALSSLDINKGISNVHQWDDEHIFYNKFFLQKDKDKTFYLTTHFDELKLYRFGQFLDEKVNESRKRPFDRKAVSLFNNVTINANRPKDDSLTLNNGEVIKFKQVTHKLLYEASISNIPGYHHSQLKWLAKLNLPTNWDDTWNTVHNFLSTNDTISLIWQQIHLNFYTQYSYNKWHKVTKECPLCGQIPSTIFHSILSCEMVNKVWDHITPILLKFHPSQPNTEEKAFGIVQRKPTPAILIRNWLTYLTRYCIAVVEKEAHYSRNYVLTRIKRKIQQHIVKELDQKLHIYAQKGKMDIFEKFYSYNNVICTRTQDNNYKINQIIL